MGSNVNQSAVLMVQGYRACALERSGRDNEAQRVIAGVVLGAPVMPDAVMTMQLCRGDTEAARALLIARLEDDATRGWALEFVQPVRAATATQLEALMQPAAKIVQSDPQVLAIVGRQGRMLARPINAMLPKDFDPCGSALDCQPSKTSVESGILQDGT